MSIDLAWTHVTVACDHFLLQLCAPVTHCGHKLTKTQPVAARYLPWSVIEQLPLFSFVFAKDTVDGDINVKANLNLRLNMRYGEMPSSLNLRKKVWYHEP